MRLIILMYRNNDVVQKKMEAFLCGCCLLITFCSDVRNRPVFRLGTINIAKKPLNKLPSIVEMVYSKLHSKCSIEYMFYI